MAQEVANGDFLADVGVCDLEARKMLDDRVIPGQLAFLDEQRDAGRSERLGTGSNPKYRPFIHLWLFAKRPHAIAAGEYDVAVLDDGDGHARNFPIGQGLL